MRDESNFGKPHQVFLFFLAGTLSCLYITTHECFLLESADKLLKARYLEEYLWLMYSDSEILYHYSLLLVSKNSI